MSDNKKFNLSLARAYKIKGGVWSVDIGPAEFDAIQKIGLGGRLVYKELAEESRKSANSPHGYFQFMTAEEVKAFKAKAGSRNKVSNRDQDF